MCYLFMNDSQNTPKPGEFYRHFKGNLYQILAVAVHTETGEPLVVYQALYGEFQIFARPLAMFQDIVENGEKRFVKVVMRKDETDNWKIDNGQGKMEKEYAKLPEEKKGYQGKNQGKNREKYQEEKEHKKIYEQMEKFYDADSYEEKLECLLPLRGKLNNIMLANIAVSLDIVIPEGSEEEQFQSIISCLRTMKKYQRSRLR